MSIGIGAIHCVLPEASTPVTELPEVETLRAEEAEFVRSSGIDRVGVFPDAPTTDFAIRAAQELGKTTALDPDVLIMVGSRSPDVLLGSDSGRLQAEGGFGRAFAFVLDGLGCTGSSAAWALARDLLLADPGRDSVLITHASRPTGVDRVRYPVTVIGDGAYAMTVVRGGRPVLVAHRQESDGAFHDLFRVDYKQAPWYEWREECQSPDRYRFELALHSRQRLSRMVDEVLGDAGISKGDVAATLMQNVTASAYGFYHSLLGLPIHPVCQRLLTEHGHLGAMDVVLNLDRLLTGGEVAPGDHVLVLNNSPVAAWAATVWQV
ncbi:3-oxoacyl-[acyl-carrier-protein] synthase III C-terminal domain-containing protein [Micromonospora sp. RTGN7]|uniref:3-oxoacyl-[acyl-carrier-protein] synthase III C-terminal domain-containing protein n=1 Tax=Micromonospora sp. RTGN7 TaxID=3016526 RepID=UPI0029FEF7A8|nr:3-oxoacyl-[acyl-carrier-protein] synthase III C-terminal domain-containing protein [Micromonospora sp. RTGN7]